MCSVHAQGFDIDPGSPRASTRSPHDGRWNGDIWAFAPTGNELAVTGIGIFPCRDGRILEQIVEYDLLGLLRQMGATTIPA